MSETGSFIVYQDHPLFPNLWLCDSAMSLERYLNPGLLNKAARSGRSAATQNLPQKL
jgi:hypothetical protein